MIYCTHIRYLGEISAEAKLKHINIRSAGLLSVGHTMLKALIVSALLGTALARKFTKTRLIRFESRHPSQQRWASTLVFLTLFAF